MTPLRAGYRPLRRRKSQASSHKSRSHAFAYGGYENALRAARDLLDGMRIIPLTRGVIDLASSAGLTSLRSLDAIHLASALTVGPELSAFVAYGRRRQAAAADEGLPVMAPA